MTRDALGSLLRSLVISTAIVTAYFALPLTSSWTPEHLVSLVLALGAVAALMTWQVRAILASPYPGLRAVGALSVSLPLFLVIFSATYYLMARSDPAGFSEPLTKLDAAYFTVTAFATVGFGDIVPVSQVARAVTMAQMVGDLVLVGLIAKVVVGAVQEGRARRRARGDRP